MTSGDYTIGVHSDVPDLAAQLATLSNAAFAEYEGAMQVDEAFAAWYLKRPGCTPELCPVALAGETLVSNVLVAIQNLQVGDEVLPCGIIDTVATAPEHRNRGLARVLMDRAHELMRQAGAEAAVLYTNPDGHPYRFYGRLGYETRAIGAALMGARPAGSGIARTATQADEADVRALLDRFYADYEGYCRQDEALWRWHRVNRPGNMPVNLVAIGRPGGGVEATIAFAQADTFVGGEHVPVSVASDPAWEGDDCLLGELLSSAPGERILCLVDEQSPLYAGLTGLGFTSTVRETAMVLPFSERARAAVRCRRGPWYVMVESVVGV